MGLLTVGGGVHGLLLVGVLVAVVGIGVVGVFEIVDCVVGHLVRIGHAPGQPRNIVGLVFGEHIGLHHAQIVFIRTRVPVVDAGPVGLGDLRRADVHRVVVGVGPFGGQQVQQGVARLPVVVGIGTGNGGVALRVDTAAQVDAGAHPLADVGLEVALHVRTPVFIIAKRGVLAQMRHRDIIFGLPLPPPEILALIDAWGALRCTI